MMSFLDSFSYSNDLSLYIHVPFCISKCAYCAFYSVPRCSQLVMDLYLERLLSEITEVNRRMAGKAYETAFIGGGNPGCLGPERLGKIAKAVCENGRPKEFSVEMNPESLTPEFFPLFKDCFTRLSMGVQSMDQKALSFLGRNADLEKTRSGLALSQLLKAETECSLSYDLITCLGSWHDELSDIKAILSEFPSDHLSVYALTLEEGTPLYQRKPELPDSDQQYEILKNVWNHLQAQGYEHYEVSNFAKPGKRCIHNCRYWGYQQYLGLGPGAASTAFSEGGNVTRFSYPHDIESYISGKAFEGFEYESLSSFEAAEELVFMGLRYKDGLDLARLERLTGKRICDAILRESEGYYLQDGKLVPDDEGLMLCDAQACTIIDALS
ncbi:MAG: coproporphyrinogen III oxidase family protein [Sphaerochaetaceae bacterium]|nr:coproporphyrinogen III oxidase family protein [Sphaerochaetaceae bacterium]